MNAPIQTETVTPARHRGLPELPAADRPSDPATRPADVMSTLDLREIFERPSSIEVAPASSLRPRLRPNRRRTYIDANRGHARLMRASILVAAILAAVLGTHGFGGDGVYFGDLVPSGAAEVASPGDSNP